MRFSDKQNARAESDRATTQAILNTMSTGVELYREVHENESFRKWILDMVFNATYVPPVAARSNRQNHSEYTIPADESPLMVAETSPYTTKDDE